MGIDEKKEKKTEDQPKSQTRSADTILGELVGDLAMLRDPRAHKLAKNISTLRVDLKRKNHR